ncbi:hypothetical protein BU16DRAFT_360496 [Lophium mytilinum]|uniref:Uncharacterized protein n=1 Tax=Lophium mytilinum TaxID=390894 RepID=A0A6A6QVI5_9PEZI|nr:hypothetical protein BU16DRAFT_360496 [Lophium mytilinum]
MSVLLESASRLKPEIRLAQAVHQFKEDLSSEQKATFRTNESSPPDPSDVMRLTAEIDRRAAQKRGVRSFGPCFTYFLQAVQQFAALGDVVVGGSQNMIACSVWSLVRMSLLAIVNFSTYLEKFSTLFMAIGRSAPRYQDMALLYPRSKRLQTQLSEYFIVVVGLCHRLLKFTQKSAIRQIVSSLSDSDLKTFQSELDIWANSIKDEITLLVASKVEEEAQGNSHFRIRSNRFYRSASHQQKLATNLRVLGFCSKYDHETTWKQTRKVGNTALFSQIAEYKEWKSKATSCTLIYTGKLGSGKSVMLANIVDDLHLYHGGKDIAVAYFFCRHDIPESLTAQTVTGSLARQLLRTIPDLAMVADSCESTTSAPDFEDVLNLLRRAFPPHRKAYFVLDGLDECDRSQRETLVQQLCMLQETLTLLVCVSFRLEPNTALELQPQQFAAATTATIPDDNPDIEGFIEAELARCLECRKLVLGDPALILEIQHALLDGSKGMFLWVALQIQTLCDKNTDQDIRETLADLPKDLSETFSRILRRSQVSGKSYQRQILQLVTVAYRYLTLDELREALGVVPGDEVWNPSRLPNDVYSTLACCGCLLMVDEEESTVRFVHHSVKQFLLGGFHDSTNTPFTLDSAQKTMADIVITYLNYGVFGTELSTMKVPQMNTALAPSSIIRSTQGPSSTVQSLALKYLKLRKHPDFDISKNLAEAGKSFQAHSVDAFFFYSYAKMYWIQHVQYFSEQELVVCDLLLKISKGKARQTIITNEEGNTLLGWAVTVGYGAVVELLLETGKIDLESGGELLFWAVKNGHDTVIMIRRCYGRLRTGTKQW